MIKIGNCIGFTLENEETGTKGVIVKQFGEADQMAVVRYWDDIWNRYDEETMNIFRSNLHAAPDNRSMLTDSETLGAYAEIAIDFSLSTNDKNWFKEGREALEILKLF